MKSASGEQMHALFEPRSVAIVGASDQPGSVGAALFCNMLQGGYAGDLWPVNPAHRSIAGKTAYASVAQLPGVPELAVVCTPAVAVPQVIAELGAVGTRAAVVLTAGLDQQGATGIRFADAMMSAARAHGLRIVGPNCVGLRVPRIGLNASFSAIPAAPGHLALVAQSGGVITAFLAWAQQRGIGLSCGVSLGNAADLGAADLLDALATDVHTHAILLYLESVGDGGRFIEAATNAARIKPVFALKVGRAEEAARVAATHTGALAGADNVWDAVLLRAGVRRLDSLRDLYGVAEIVGRVPAPLADRVAIVTNSGGPAVLAVDALMAGGGSLAMLSEECIGRLDAFLPATWSRRNPVDIIGDATPARFAQALDVVTTDASAATTLLIHAPTDMAAAAAVQRECAPAAQRPEHRIVGCWLDDRDASRDTQAAARMPGFATPEEAVAAILHVAAAGRLRSRASVASPARLLAPAGLAAIRDRIRAEMVAGRTLLSSPVAQLLLQAFGVPVAATRVVHTVAELQGAALQLGYPLVLKILSPDIVHKSDVGAVVTGIVDGMQLEQEAVHMLQRCASERPGARIEGFVLQVFVRVPHARELIVGITRDTAFGPVVLFGAGGTAVHVLADTAIGIPPLDRSQAQDLVRRTRVHALLAAYRDCPAVDSLALEGVLTAVAQMALDVPELRELDINPLLAHPGGVMALDVRIRVG